jgi:hypothetical protein
VSHDEKSFVSDKEFAAGLGYIIRLGVVRARLFWERGRLAFTGSAGVSPADVGTNKKQLITPLWNFNRVGSACRRAGTPAVPVAVPVTASRAHG